MTNKEAIEIIRAVRKQYIPRTVFDEANEALDLAIKALEERPTGECAPTDRLVTERTLTVQQYREWKKER